MVQSIPAPALIIDQEATHQPGQTPPELMAADMQVQLGFRGWSVSSADICHLPWAEREQQERQLSAWGNSLVG